MKKLVFVTILLANSIILFSQEYKFYALSSDGEVSHPVYLCELTPETGAISVIEKYSGVTGANYIAISPDYKHLLVTSPDPEKNGGGLVQYNLSDDGTLTLATSEFNEGGTPCHVSMSPDMKYIFSADYGGDKISLHTFSNQKISPVTDNIVKSDKSRGHYISADPSGRFVHAVFLGLDKIFSYKIEDDKFVPNASQEYFSLPEGAGPRHMVFHPDKNRVYILNEINSSVTAGSYDPKTGVITEIQNISMLPSDFDEFSKAAAIRLHPNGKFLYASNRGHNSIAVYKIAGDGKLSIVEYETSGINFPRDFNISPDGKFMVVGNQQGNSVFSFRINKKTGELDYTGMKLVMPSPLSFVFLP